MWINGGVGGAFHGAIPPGLEQGGEENKGKKQAPRSGGTFERVVGICKHR